jgi:hypothetical protein
MRSFTTLAFALSIGLALVACSKKKAEPAATPAPAGSATPPAPEAKKPFTGPLTAALVMEAAHQIDVYTPDAKPAPFAAALAQAKTVIGEPTHVDGTKYEWGVVEGDHCTYYVLEDAGGTAKSPGSMGVASSDADCLAAAGKAPAAGSGSDAGSAAGSGTAAN